MIQTLRWLLCGLVLLVAVPLHATEAVYVPPALQPWVEWVLHDQPQRNCPAVEPNQRLCDWTSQLILNAQASGADFDLRVSVLGRSAVTLPGDTDHWPQAVSVDGQPAAVLAHPIGEAGETRPVVFLPPGTAHIRGRLTWDALPERLAIPPHAGNLRLQINGQAVERPFVADGTLFFGTRQTSSVATEQDRVDVRVFRRLVDAVPPQLETQLQIDVSGQPRELLLGRALPAGFRLLGLRSQLPARVEDNGELRLLASAGSWTVGLSAAQIEPVQASQQFVMQRTTPDWPAQEVWTYVTAPGLRLTRVEGAAPVDPSQARTPFVDGAAYLLDEHTNLTLVEEQRGNVNPAPDLGQLQRRAWLDFDGTGLTLVDLIQINVHTPRRLRAQHALERVLVNGEPAVISTSPADASTGIEVGAGRLLTEVVSRAPRGAPLAVSPWDVDLQTSTAELLLPPGWRLLTAAGVDQESHSWLAAWSLLDVFLVMITVVATWRLFGLPWATLMAITLIVGYQESAAIRGAWLWLLVLAALVRLLPAGRLPRVLTVVYALSSVALIWWALEVSSQRLSAALYPQLALESMEGQVVLGEAGFEMLEAPVAKSRLASRAYDAVEAVASSSPPPRPPVAVDTRIDAGDAAQIGRGAPQWNWQSATLFWNGPVQAGQSVDLWLLPPWLVRLLHVLVAAGTLLLLALMLRQLLPDDITPPRALRWLRAASIGIAGVIGLQLWAPPAASADVDAPPPELLDTLRARLTAAPECEPTCYAYEHTLVNINPQALRIVLQVHAGSRVAVPLPVAVDWPATVLDAGGQPALLYRHGERLLVLLEPGSHALSIAGSVAGFDTLNLPFPPTSGRVDLDSRGWLDTGLVRGRVSDGTLQLRRAETTARGASQATLAANLIEPFVNVHRELLLESDWRLRTTVRRVVPDAGAINLRIPRLAGESLLAGGMEVQGDSVVVSMAHGTNEVQWTSRLDSQSPLQLVAGAAASMSERWQISAHSRWHVDTEGLLPDVPDADGALVWSPRAGEALQVLVSRPAPVAGPVWAIDALALDITPAARTVEYRASAAVRASVGDRWTFPLPADAELVQVTIDGDPQPLPAAGAPLVLPLVPGAQELAVTWRGTTGIDTWMTTPALALERGVSNVRLVMNMPHNRWTLWLQGPQLGPAVVLWGFVTLALLLAVLAGGVRQLQVSRLQLVLLSLGLATCNLWGLLVIALWFGMIMLRPHLGAALESRIGFNLMQILMVLGTLVFLATLAGSVTAGLLGRPDMLISGNGSSAYLYNWYADYAADTLPVAAALSLPLWLYRLLMLAWSLWLALALLGWLRFAWQAFCSGGLWRAPVPRAPADQPAA